MIKKYHTISYIKAKINQYFFLKSNPDTPWMTKDSINLIEQLMNPEDVGIEFGSGRSTIWFAKRCKEIISIEDNAKWFDIVSKKIEGKSNITYLKKQANDENPLDCPYTEIFKEVKDESLDFIVNDGKCRGAIALKAIEKLKTGGMMILDNAERHLPNKFGLPDSMGRNTEDTDIYWKKFIDTTKSWRVIWTSNGIWNTVILIKA